MGKIEIWGNQKRLFLSSKLTTYINIDLYVTSIQNRNALTKTILQQSTSVKFSLSFQRRKMCIYEHITYFLSIFIPTVVWILNIAWYHFLLSLIFPQNWNFIADYRTHPRSPFNLISVAAHYDPSYNLDYSQKVLQHWVKEAIQSGSICVQRL